MEDVTEQEMKRLVDEGLSIMGIAERTGLTRKGVLSALRRYGLRTKRAANANSNRSEMIKKMFTVRDLIASGNNTMESLVAAGVSRSDVNKVVKQMMKDGVLRMELVLC